MPAATAAKESVSGWTYEDTQDVIGSSPIASSNSKDGATGIRKRIVA